MKAWTAKCEQDDLPYDRPNRLHKPLDSSYAIAAAKAVFTIRSPVPVSGGTM